MRDFVVAFTGLCDTATGEAEQLVSGRQLLADLVAHDDWLPAAFAEPDPERYRQYLLHCDSLSRFCVVSFVWGPGQGTPIHDHRTWGLIGMLRGAETVERFERTASGALAAGPVGRLAAGDTDAVGPAIGDLHRVSNGLADAPSISIHVYGANIGEVERATYFPDGEARRFISGYANDVVPNLWQGPHRR